MKLKISQINQLKEAISSLEGTPRVVKIVTDGVSSEKIITEPFKFGGKIRWNLSKNLSILTHKMEGFNKVRNDLLMEISEGAGLIKADDHERKIKFNQQLEEIINSEEDVSGILKLSEADLNLDENPIPLSAIVALQPILE